MPLEQRAHRAERVVLEVLAADVVKGVLRQHEREIAHLNDPHASRMEDPCDVGHKRIRILEVVEHGNAGHHLRTLVAAQSLKVGGAEEIVHGDRAPLLGIGHEVRRRLEAHAEQPCRLVGTEERAVVAPDVEDQIAWQEWHEPFGGPHDIGEGRAHGAIHARAVPVVTVEKPGVDGMSQLE